MLVKKIVALVIFLSCFSLYAQHVKKSTDCHQKFTQQELKHDFLFLRSAYEKFHPALYSYTSKQDLDHAFDSIESLLTREMTTLDFYRSITPVNASIRCSHTELLLPPVLENRIQQSYFPWDIKFTDEKAFVVRSQDNSISPGTNLLRINGREISDMLAIFKSRLTADGFSTSSVLAKLNNNFPYYYNLYIEQAAIFTVEYINDEGSNAVVTIKALPSRFNESKQKMKSYSITFKDHQTAVLEVRNFNTSQQEFKFFLDSCFVALQKQQITNLILDVRGNRGGYMGNAFLLLSYLTDMPLKIFDSLQWKTNDVPKHFLEGEMREILFSNASSTISLKIQGNNNYMLPHSVYPVIHPNTNRFRGNIFILINGLTGSAASHLCALIQHHKLATFIGEETGGNFFWNAGVDYINITLPNTGLRLRIPFMKAVYAVSSSTNPKGKGVIPEYPIPTSVKDIVEKNDPQTRFALALIRKNGMTAKENKVVLNKNF